MVEQNSYVEIDKDRISQICLELDEFAEENGIAIVGSISTQDGKIGTSFISGTPSYEAFCYAYSEVLTGASEWLHKIATPPEEDEVV